MNDAPALTGSVATLIAGTEDTAYVVNATDLLTGYTDVDGNALSVVNLLADHGTVVNNGNGTYTITPALNYNGAMAEFVVVPAVFLIRVPATMSAAAAATVEPLSVAAHAAGQGTIKVGLIAPFSGPFADYGKQMEGGIKAYMAQHGSTVAGKKVEILVRDSTGPAPEIAKRGGGSIINISSIAGSGAGFSGFAGVRVHRNHQQPMSQNTGPEAELAAAGVLLGNVLSLDRHEHGREASHDPDSGR